jgi:hypothetical protein
MLNMSDIPDSIEYVGFITPSFFRKSGLTLQQITPPSHDLTIRKFVGAPYDTTETYIEFAEKHHGPTFRYIWEWLIRGLGYNPYNMRYTVTHMYCNMWILSRKNVEIFLDIAKKAIHILDNAPPYIRNLLFTNSNYDGRLNKESLQSLCSTEHYPFHPFIMERLIAFVCDRYNWTVENWDA